MRNINGEIPISVKGLVVSRVYLDSAFGIQFFGGSGEVTIRIEGTFDLCVGGATYTMSHTRSEELVPALGLYGREVVLAEASENGRLLMRFSDDVELEVLPDPDFEAWEAAGPGTSLFVSLPGGGIAVWSASE